VFARRWLSTCLLAFVAGWALAASGPAAVPEAEFKKVVAEIKAMAPSVDRATVVMEAARHRWVSTRQARVLLELIPPGCGRLEAAGFLHGRLSDPAEFYRLYGLFPDVGDQQALREMAKGAGPPVVDRRRVRGRTSEAQPSPSPSADDSPAGPGYTAGPGARVRVEVVDTQGRPVTQAKVYFCGLGPMSPPVLELIKDQDWFYEGCQLQVWLGERLVYEEGFVPSPTQDFHRRVRIENF
jgi:hypothetical protein